MTLEEWCLAIDEKLVAEGFEVECHMGFPLVTIPADQESFKRLIELTFKVPCHIRLYAGRKALFAPA